MSAPATQELNMSLNRGCSNLKDLTSQSHRQHQRVEEGNNAPAGRPLLVVACMPMPQPAMPSSVT